MDFRKVIGYTQPHITESPLQTWGSRLSQTILTERWRIQLSGRNGDKNACTNLKQILLLIEVFYLGFWLFNVELAEKVSQIWATRLSGQPQGLSSHHLASLRRCVVSRSSPPAQRPLLCLPLIADLSSPALGSWRPFSLSVLLAGLRLGVQMPV